jgi:hypothetical protein
LDKYTIDVGAVQEIRWPGKGIVTQMNFMNLCSGHKSDKHESGTGFFCINTHNLHNLLDFEPVNERICKIRIKLKYYNLTLISYKPQLKKR